MIYQGVLRSRGEWADIDIQWDSDTGEFAGPDAETAEQMVELAQGDGYIELMPCVHHPLTGEALTAEEVGSILNSSWQAAAVFPLVEPDTDLPENAVS